eukprot:scaffold10612_cov70-Phaeocystis_antarctica.AAC.3
MCGELKPRSGPEGAGLPGAATERLSTGAERPGYVWPLPRSVTWSSARLASSFCVHPQSDLTAKADAKKARLAAEAEAVTKATAEAEAKAAEEATLAAEAEAMARAEAEAKEGGPGDGGEASEQRRVSRGEKTRRLGEAGVGIRRG